ncbi:MAG: N-6 DNA methylase, partial [Actinomycetaceae bacterium]|nr:N-6 DNA methylase [Actinomycetaceae bacterium]
MNDSAIKNYAIWARRELMAGVRTRSMLYGIDSGDSVPADAESVNGRVLSALEREQRRDLLAAVKRDGIENLIEQAAYTWFNRLLAIRFMEVNDRLPSHIRLLSATDGSFKPQALDEVLNLPFDSLDFTDLAELVQRGDDEATFRRVFLAQCDELADVMPSVFEKVGSALELLLPDDLLRRDGVVERLVRDIPESDWTEGVEIVGWMYQYYVSERKDEVFESFKKRKKADRDSIAPATQLFTPAWIVQYLTENSLGRLWVLNNPDSSLVSGMPYFVRPDEDSDLEFKRVSSPEEITVIDPACGSGHILVYAFDLLARMYAEAGYSSKDAARLIVEKNLFGAEIDPRAAAMASFALTMKACEVDPRFLRRAVSPNITVLSRTEFDSNELLLLPSLSEHSELLEAVEHLDECGSLLEVDEEQISAVERDLASLAGDDTIFA